jgi:hypothetical protein
MLNIAALNFCYDVPVKLFSTNLLLMAVYLAAGDARRLANVLVLNRPVAAADLSAPQFERRGMRTAAMAFWVLLVGYQLVGGTVLGWKRYRQSYIDVKYPPISGLYEVEEFTRNGREAPPLTTEGKRWRKTVFQGQGMTVRTMDDTVTTFGAEYDAAKSTVTLNKKDGLTWMRPDAEHVTLAGKVGSDTVSMRLRRIDASKFRLVSRGFHWINELPFNQ